MLSRVSVTRSLRSSSFFLSASSSSSSSIPETDLEAGRGGGRAGERKVGLAAEGQQVIILNL
jgi:hypothetical protein